MVQSSEYNISEQQIRLVILVGPTAVGKTAAGIELARKIGGEIISADSMAIYKGMDIATAKPDAREQQSARFHMIDVVDPDEPFTVVDFTEGSVETIDRLLSEGKWPILLGGTGFYLEAVVNRLNIPETGPDPDLRARLAAEAQESGSQVLYDRLSGVDPKTASRLHPNDLKRIIRALEVYELTGIPMSDLHEASDQKPRYPDAAWFGLTMDRELLYRRIEERVDQQIRQGLLEEVRALLDKGYDVSLPSMQGLGYKEVVSYLKGECSLEQAVDTLKRNTRRFAKRQFTWFRPNKKIEWIDAEGKSADQVAEIIKDKLLRGV